jgi:hypothetical protein
MERLHVSTTRVGQLNWSLLCNELPIACTDRNIVLRNRTIARMAIQLHCPFTCGELPTSLSTLGWPVTLDFQYGEKLQPYSAPWAGLVTPDLQCGEKLQPHSALWAGQLHWSFKYGEKLQPYSAPWAGQLLWSFTYGEHPPILSTLGWPVAQVL